jgi:hypothetical protein
MSCPHLFSAWVLAKQSPAFPNYFLNNNIFLGWPPEQWLSTSHMDGDYRWSYSRNYKLNNLLGSWLSLEGFSKVAFCWDKVIEWGHCLAHKVCASLGINIQRFSLEQLYIYYQSDPRCAYPKHQLFKMMIYCIMTGSLTLEEHTHYSFFSIVFVHLRFRELEQKFQTAS